jgi:hypothetical protein
MHGTCQAINAGVPVPFGVESIKGLEGTGLPFTVGRQMVAVDASLCPPPISTTKRLSWSAEAA